MTLPRRVPPEPSAAAIEAAAKRLRGVCDVSNPAAIDRALKVERRIAADVLRAAYAVEAPPPVVTVAQVAALLQECPHLFNCEDFDQPYDLAATWLHAHLVPPEAP